MSGTAMDNPFGDVDFVPTPPVTREEWEELTKRAEAVIQQEAHDPQSFQPLMHECHVLLMDIGLLLSRLNDQRYEAERAWSKKKNQVMGRHVDLGATFARARGEVAAMDERKAADDLKVIYHHAEDTQTALQAKHYALMNINKGLQSAMFEGGRRG